MRKIKNNSKRTGNAPRFIQELQCDESFLETRVWFLPCFLISGLAPLELLLPFDWRNLDPQRLGPRTWASESPHSENMQFGLSKIRQSDEWGLVSIPDSPKVSTIPAQKRISRN